MTQRTGKLKNQEFQATGVAGKIPDMIASAIRCYKSGLFDQAEYFCRHILQINSDQADVLHLLGLIAYHKKKTDTACDLISKAISKKPHIPDFYNSIALVLADLGREKEAIEAYGQALQLKPDYAEVYFNLGKLFSDKGRLDEAIRHFSQALSIKPNYEKAYNNLGNVLYEKGKIDEAIKNYQQALRLKPDYVGALNNLGNALIYKGDLDEAIQIFEHSIEVNPSSAATYCNFGNALKDLYRFEDAIENYKKAIRLKPDFIKAHFNLSIVFLLLGDFSRGWEEYEWRLKELGKATDYPNRYGLPIWDGSPLEGKTILVYDEQGFGDTLQFVRYLPQLKTMGANIVFETRGPLIPLLKSFLAIDELVDRMTGVKHKNKCDYCIPLLSLPRRFKTSLETIPKEVPYLYAPPQKIENWSPCFSGEGLRVGVTWAGKSVDINLDQFETFARISGVSLYGLQKGEISGQDRELAGKILVTNFGDELKDFSDTAGVIENLDLVISIDTSLAHLAGAMGKPVWVLLPFIPDWRWLLDREDSPWYPTMRLYRQKIRGNWEEAIKRVANSLEQLAGNHNTLEALDLTVNRAEVLYHQGNDCYDQGRLYDSIALYQKAVRLRSNFYEAFFNMGRAYQDLKEFDEAINSYQKAIKLNPDFPQAYYNVGVLFHQKENLPQAISFYRQALSFKTGFAECLNNMGAAYLAMGEVEEAIASFEQALEVTPDYKEALYNLARSFQDMGDYDAAIDTYRKVVRIDPNHPGAWHSMGKVFYARKNLDDSRACLQKALALNPDDVEVLFDLGVVLRDFDQLTGMIACYEKAIQIRPDVPQAYLNLAVAYKQIDQLEKAISYCYKAMAIQPDFDEAFSYLVQLKQHACAWDGLEKLLAKLDLQTSRRIKRGLKAAESPILNLRRHDDPGLNYIVAKSWSDAIAKELSRWNISLSFASHNSLRTKIRVGYLSNDFKNNVVMHLIQGLFRTHDHEKFEIIAYSHGKDDGSNYRQKIKQYCDGFVEIDDLNHNEAAECINSDGIDILVDLMGYTRGNRLEICALRPAPIQVGYLGFLGTTGSSYIDYIITDRIATPAEHARFYSEKFVYLPNCYQVNDNTLHISDKPWKRSDCGLPQKGFVFCSFNQPYKIDFLMFNSWINILKQVPESVLCLLRQSIIAERNLKQAARTHGIDPKRLIFANPLPLEEHLARLKLADLALDTRIYNGGATTSNALWAGVPVITLQGNHFLSRMSSSSLLAIGLPELVTRSLNEYEALAIRLARKPSELDAVSQKLSRNCFSEPLFDTPRFTLNLEKAYKMMWERHVHGERPRQIEVKEEIS